MYKYWFEKQMPVLEYFLTFFIWRSGLCNWEWASASNVKTNLKQIETVTLWIELGL